MKRLGWGLAVLLAAPLPLFADEPAEAPAPEAAPDTGPAADTDTEPPVAKQEIGARLGAQVGLSSLSPGGLRLGGVYLYRMSEDMWFDGEAAFSFGADARSCWYGRQTELTLECAHGGVDGFGMGLLLGVRWFAPRRPTGFHPYVRGGVALSYASFSADEVVGGGLGLWGGAGGRFRVAPRVAIVGEALVSLDRHLYNEGLGLGVGAGLAVQFGVELGL